MELRALGDQGGGAEYWRWQSWRDREREKHDGDLQRVSPMYSVVFRSAHSYLKNNQGQGKNHLKGLEVTVLGPHTGPG